jgi:transcription factor SPN1
MMARKKDEKRKRKRKDVDIINDNDDLIDHMIQQMRMACEVNLLLFFCCITNYLFYQ